MSKRPTTRSQTLTVTVSTGQNTKEVNNQLVFIKNIGLCRDRDLGIITSSDFSLSRSTVLFLYYTCI